VEERAKRCKRLEWEGLLLDFGVLVFAIMVWIVVVNYVEDIDNKSFLVLLIPLQLNWIKNCLLKFKKYLV